MQKETIRVILVDDHQLVRETWRLLLSSHGQVEVVSECASAAEAIEQSSLLNPHVVLMDVNMYPVNGLEATRILHSRAPHIRIIGVSVNNQPAYARNMLEAGACGYVTKNSSREEMIEAIRAVVRGETYICREVREKMGG